jgi:hypothetical protein
MPGKYGKDCQPTTVDCQQSTGVELEWLDRSATSHRHILINEQDTEKQVPLSLARSVRFHSEILVSRTRLAETSVKKSKMNEIRRKLPTNYGNSTQIRREVCAKSPYLNGRKHSNIHIMNDI